MTDGGRVLDEFSSARERDTSPQPGGRSAWVRRGITALVVRPTPSHQASTEITPTSAPLSALRWTVRGDLADDTEFTSAVLDVARANDPAAEKVLYAATLPDRSRFAFVATGYDDAGGPGFRSAGVQALHVSAGAAPSVRDLTFAGEVTSPDALVGWAGHGRDGEVYAVLLGRPAPLEAHVSSAIDYTKDGTAHRGWQPVRSRDGSAIVELGREADPLVVARTTYGEDSYPLLMTVDGDPTDKTRDMFVAAVRIDGLDDSYRGPNRTAGRSTRKASARCPGADAELAPWILQTGQPGVPHLLVNPSGAGTATIAPAGGEEPRRLRIGRTGVADLGNDPDAVARTLSHALVTVLAPSGRRIVQVELPGIGEDDPFVLDSL